jgi:chaperonin GroEL (HSP60 family)
MTQLTDANQEGGQGSAHQHNIATAKQIGDFVKSTLGPAGLDKMLVAPDGKVTVTNDGATIMREMHIVNETARLIVQVAKTQEAECYDGTTSAVIIAGELMKQAEDLLSKGIHPNMIAKGFKKACVRAQECLNTLCIEGELENVAMTAMTGKSAEEDKEHLAKVCVEAVAKSLNPEKINVVTRPGAPVTKTFMIDGVIIDKSKVNHGMVEKITKASVALLDLEMVLPDMSKGINVQFTSGDEADAYMAKRKQQLISMADHLIEVGANVVLCLKDIDSVVAEHFARSGILAARRVAASDLEMVAEATGGMIVSNLNDLEPQDLGSCDVVEQVEYRSSDRPLLMFKGCNNDSVSSIMVFAPTEHLVFEIGRAIDDALGVVYIADQHEMVCGGGSTHMEMSLAVKEYATTVGGRAQMAVEAFANALEVIPATLAENSGLSPIDCLIALRAAHAQGLIHAYIDLDTGEIGKSNNHVLEPKQVVGTALQSATDVACMIIRIDHIIRAKDPDDPFGMV